MIEKLKNKVSSLEIELEYKRKRDSESEDQNIRKKKEEIEEDEVILSITVILPVHGLRYLQKMTIFVFTYL